MSNTFKIRKKLLVDREYQFQFIKLVLAQTLITSLVLIGSFYFFQKSQSEFVSGLSLGQEKVKIVQHWTSSMVTKIVCVVVLACIFQCVLALILSSRAAGPMYRLRKYLLNVSQGVPPEPIQFREHDSFHNVQDAYNEMVKVLEKERLNDLRIIQQMEDGIASLKIAAKDEYTFQLADYIERLNNDLKNFKTH